VSDDALDLFFSAATQYYVTGRFAILAQQIPVAGNLLHHAIEMYLKGGLAKTTTLQDLKKLSHSLPRVWSAFKVRFPDPGLNTFDNLVSSLNDFEELRYPDSVLVRGMSVVTGVTRTPLPPLPPGAVVRLEPKYELYLDEVDSLVGKLFEVISVNPKFFLGGLHPTARQYLTESNTNSWAG
jgi:hypothetical protein